MRTRTPSRLLAAAASAVVVALAATPAVAGAASPAKPTIVFVHGAWADGSGFNSELRYFSRRGYKVASVANPLRGLTADSDYVRARLQAIPGPIVFLAGWALDKGDSVNSLSTRFAGTGSLLNPDPKSPAFSFDVVPVANPVAPGGKSIDTYIKQKYFRGIFAGDVSQARADLQAETQRPLTDLASGEASGVPAWKTIPSWFLVTTQDRAISPPTQKFMAKRAGSKVSYVKSAHDVMISHPAAAERIITRAITHR